MAIVIWRHFLSCAVFAVFLGISMPGVLAADFFRSIDDLPLAPGMTEAVEQGVQFDSPSGRIVTAVARSGTGNNAGGTGGAGAVRAFYRKALPPLGWSHVAGDIYRREGERLSLRIDKAGSGVIVHIRLVPAAAN